MLRSRTTRYLVNDKNSYAGGGAVRIPDSQSLDFNEHHVTLTCNLMNSF